MLDSTVTPSGLPRLHVTHRDLEVGVCLVAIEGEVDLASAPALKSALVELVAAGTARFVLDLSGAPYMDSTGLGVLVGVQRRLPAGGVIAVAGAQPSLRDLFTLTGLDRTFKLFGTVDEAVAELTAPSPARAALSPDGALVVGLVATAIPFADSRAAEAERWLRVLRLHGEAGRALTALGLGEAPLTAITPSPYGDHGPRGAGAVASVIEHAAGLATERGSGTVGTADLLVGAMTVYGADFDRVLEAHGSARGELIDHLVVNARKLTSA
jgi:anti-sigma B factor antagonist